MGGQVIGWGGWLYFSNIQISWRRISGLVVGEYLYFFTLVKSVGIEEEEAMAPFGLLLPGCLHVRALLQNCDLHQVLGVFTLMPGQGVLRHLAEVSVVFVGAFVV